MTSAQQQQSMDSHPVSTCYMQCVQVLKGRVRANTRLSRDRMVLTDQIGVLEC